MIRKCTPRPWSKPNPEKRRCSNWAILTIFSLFWKKPSWARIRTPAIFSLWPSNKTSIFPKKYWNISILWNMGSFCFLYISCLSVWEPQEVGAICSKWARPTSRFLVWIPKSIHDLLMLLAKNLLNKKFRNLWISLKIRKSKLILISILYFLFPFYQYIDSNPLEPDYLVARFSPALLGQGKHS